MSSRFEPLPDASTWFRLAVRGMGFLPTDSVIPIASWLRPTASDEQEARARDRTPGLSVWDREIIEIEPARALAGKPMADAFGMRVARTRQIGQTLGRSLQVVRDPLDDRTDQPGWDGHCLLEGLHWDGSSKRERRTLREAVVAEVVPVE